MSVSRSFGQNEDEMLAFVDVVMGVLDVELAPATGEPVQVAHTCLKTDHGSTYEALIFTTLAAHYISPDVAMGLHDVETLAPATGEPVQVTHTRLKTGYGSTYGALIFTTLAAHYISPGVVIGVLDVETLAPATGEPVQVTHTILKIGHSIILPIPILYGVWHTKAGSGEVVNCATVVQQYCNHVGNADGGW